MLTAEEKRLKRLEYDRWYRSQPDKKVIRRAAVYKWRENNKEYHLNYNRALRYGISIEELEAMTEQQKGMCAICKVEKGSHVDHNHVTGKVRGMLCGNCNRGIGCLKDNITFLNNAIEYLRRHSNSNG